MFSTKVISLLITILLILTTIDCKKFCDDPTIACALTYGVEYEVLLFCVDQYWIFRTKFNSVLKKAYKVEDPDINSIDTIFMTTDSQIVYIFSKNRYHLMKIERQNDTGTFQFNKLPTDTIVPKKWNISGGDLSEWFPKDIDDAILLEDNLLIFHGSSIRYTKVDNEWPKETEKTEIQFSGSLENISKIDAIFELSATDIVIIERLKYCRFNKNQINFNAIKELKISCEWKDSKHDLFKCQNNTSETTVLTTGTAQQNSGTSETSETETSVGTTTDPKKTSMAVLLIVIFLVLILVIIGFVILIAFILKKFLDKKNTSSSPNKTKFNRTSDSSSVATLDTKEGPSESTTQSS